MLEHGALPEITGNVEIVGSLTPTAAPTIDANGRARPFFIGRPGDVTLKRLTIINGKAPNGSCISQDLHQPGRPGEVAALS